ncbi:MAG: IreB family regulatory phosphoprotein [Oscillospiraceae bacterium]|jgi:uncharacterized protein (UPF0297 family)|nr:IreB family regulatory phosphoprotein [Oscillospiraceae bacterium]
MVDNFGTKKFSPIDPSQEIRVILQAVYSALQKKGYDPINQLVGYLVTEDPTYITGYENARTLITSVERDDILKELLKSYLENGNNRFTE